MNLDTLYTYPVSSKALVRENYSRAFDTTDNCSTLFDATIIPYIEGAEELQGECFDNQKRIISGVLPTTNYADSTIAAANNNIFLSTATTVRETTPTIYLGLIHDCWGHFFTDGFAKLWFLRTQQYRELNDLCKQKHNRCIQTIITVAYKAKATFPKAYAALIDLFLSDIDIEYSLNVLTEPTTFDSLYIPDNALIIDNECCSRKFSPLLNSSINTLIANTLRHIEGNCNYKPYDKIYFSRTRLLHKVAEFGEKAIERSFKKAGFHIVYPEEIPFAEQLFYLQNCHTFASTEGSLGHNSIFCKPGTKVILLRKAWMQYDMQFCINQMRDLNVSYIDVHLSVFVTDNPNLGPFFLYITDCLSKYMLDNYGISIANNFSRKKFMQYAENCIQRKDLFYRRDCPQEFYDLLYEEMSKNINPIKQIYRSVLQHLPLKRHIQRFTRIFTR